MQYKKILLMIGLIATVNTGFAQMMSPTNELPSTKTYSDGGEYKLFLNFVSTEDGFVKRQPQKIDVYKGFIQYGSIKIPVLVMHPQNDLGQLKLKFELKEGVDYSENLHVQGVKFKSEEFIPNAQKLILQKKMILKYQMEQNKLKNENKENSEVKEIKEVKETK